MKTVVFTDLDATLLDSETYSWAPATEALEALKERQASIVLVSSKTLDEMEPLHGELGLNDPFVVENGGGIVFSPQMRIADQLVALSNMTRPISRGDFLMLPLGVRYERLMTALVEISRETRIPVRGFSAMSVEEVASLTGLRIREAERARTRDFDEPFIVTQRFGIPENMIEKAARQRGLTVVQGGRFWHLIGHEGKGRAVSLLIETYRRMYGSVITIGLGDSPNDYPFLELVDIPVVVGGADSGLILPDSLKRARLTSATGPEGWNGTIIAILLDVQA
jgi:mannosyl-3-phosphoglycerate phosphatase